MTDCEKYQELISAMLDGELTETEKAEIEAHIAGCDECRAMYEAFSAASGAMTAEEVPDTLHSGIMEKVNAAAKAKKTHGLIVRLRPMLATAACLVVVVGTVVALRGNLGMMKRAESAAPAAAEAPAAMAYGFARTESAAVTGDSGVNNSAPNAGYSAVSEDSVPAEGAAYEAKSAANAPEMPMPAPEEQIRSETETEAAAEDGQSMTVEIRELLPYDAFIGFLVADAETGEVFEMHLSEDTQMTDEVRKTLATGSVVTVEYHTVETDERPVIYADAVFPNDHVLTVKATEFWDNSGFTAEVVDAAAVPCKVGDTVKVVIDERTGPIPFNIIPDVEYRIAVDGYEQTAKDGVSIYAAAIWLT